MCDWFTDLASWKKIVIVCLSVVIFISFWLIGYSVTILEPLYWGLEFDKNGMKVDTEKLFRSGRHFTGLGYEFLEFPRTQQILYFSDVIKSEKKKKGARFSEEAKKYETISARTADGLKIYVDIFIGYEMTTQNEDSAKISQLWDIYSKFGENWNNFLVLVIHAVVRDTFMEYEALKIPKSRIELGNRLFATLEEKFSNYHFRLIMANIINIQYPQEVDSALAQTELVDQQLKAMEFKKVVAEKEQENSIYLAEIDAELSYEYAISQANIYKAEKDQLKDTQIKKVEKYAEAVNYIKNSFFDGSPTVTQIQEFLWIYSFTQNNVGSVVIETSQP